MIYTGKILDAAGTPVSGAALSFKTDAGAVITSIPVTNGAWSLDSGFDDALLMPGVIAVFSAPGYQEYRISSETMPEVFNVNLAKSVNKTALIAAGAGLGVVLLVLAKKGKLIRGAEAKSIPAWVLPVGILGAGGFILYQLFGKADPRIKQGGTLPASAGIELQTEISQGRGPTITNSEADALAASIVQAANDCGTDENAIYSAFATLKNKADLLLLIQVYGVKVYKACFDGDYFSDTPRNLAETITSEFGATERATLNSILQTQGINFSF